MNDGIRTILGVALIVAAVVLSRQDKPRPAPPQPEPSPLAVSLKFSGETAKEDATLLAAFFAELADEIEADGRLEKPLLSAGVHLDTLRTRARIARVRGQSIGDRQPAVREAIGGYLTTTLGTSGGPVDAAQRGKWVNSFREIARACDAAK
jgi:hypothetical protein